MAQQTLDFFVKKGSKPAESPHKTPRGPDSGDSEAPAPKKPRPNPLASYRRGNAGDPQYFDNPDNLARHEAALRQFGPKTHTNAPVKRKYTPLHTQFIELKRANPNTILFIEMGFRYRAYGQDAVDTARVFGFRESNGWLSIDETQESDVLFDNFATFGFPVHRLAHYVNKMVNKGFRVATVAQTETAAMKKAGTSKSGPFKRQITAIYTEGTYINDFDTDLKDEAITGGTIMSIYEYTPLNFAICCVRASTGEIIYDEFTDTAIIGELETRVLHLEPCEILLVGQASPVVVNLVKMIQARNKLRIENVDEALPDLDQTRQFSNHVQIAIQCVHNYLEEFGLQDLFALPDYTHFNIRHSMCLEGNTLSSLEIFHNTTDFKVHGSLFWVMDNTITKFGQRLLKKWVAQPLYNREALEQRVDAVAQLIKEFSAPVGALRDRLKHTPDLERLLLQVHYGRITPKQLYELLSRFHKTCTAYTPSQIRSENLKNPLARELFELVPTAAPIIEPFLQRINPTPGEHKTTRGFFYPREEGPIADQTAKIQAIEERFNEFLATVDSTLDAKYVSVSDQPFFIETKVANVKRVPKTWQKTSGTKAVARFRTPETFALLKEYDLAKEEMQLVCDQEFARFVEELKGKYAQLRAVVRALAQIDCLMSLAALSSKPGYTKVEYVDDHCIEIENGRHPVVDELLVDDYIPNDTKMYSGNNKTMIITGPNMGGKSSYVRQCALIVIMAQVGAFVPAQRARICMVDAIYTRMGAYDNMMAGESTFQVELKECANIMKKATSKSLVLLDEIGRGTSTTDGVAIAYAVLDYMIKEIQSFTLFITHYPIITELADEHKPKVANWCMEFSQDPGSKLITFLYRIVSGASHRSYGLNVARLAQVPESVVEVAERKSNELEKEIRYRRTGNQLLSLTQSVLAGDEQAVSTLVSATKSDIQTEHTHQPH